LLTNKQLVVAIDMFDRLATPWGLVRAGVAPDHPNIKSVSRVYEKTAGRPGFRFHGNVEVGADVTHEELASAYHAVLYAVGAATDRRLGIPGEDLPGSHAATEFVAWYNGHPDYADRSFDLSHKRAVVIGNGNVALDVARMLALTVEELAQTDVADHALEALRDRNIQEIIVLGRRGPAQAAFTSPELRELGEMSDADVVVQPEDVALDPVSQEWLTSDQASGTVRKNVEILTGYSRREPAGRRGRIVLRFLVSPLEILGDKRVEGVRIVRNELVPSASGTLTARPTGHLEEIEAGLVLRSVGYRGSPIPGLPFDENRAVIHNELGRATDPMTGEPLRGVYVAGWIKRGPSGVIGTNKRCAQETVDRLLQDVAAGRWLEPATDPDDLLAEMKERGVEVVDYVGWESIDAHERALGDPVGRPRIKLVRREELLERAAGRTREAGTS
jgi:ferredoxin--NADP+ reductase